MTTPQYRLVYIRHGETEWSASGRHTGRTDIQLTETGVAQAAALRPVLEELELVRPRVWTSPRSRARSTAELAGLPVAEVVDDLAEWDYGDYEGLTKPVIRERNPGWTVWTQGAPGGESVADLTARADRLVTRIRTAQESGDVVLVAHGHLGRALISRYLGEPVEFGRRLPILPASVAVLGVDEDGVPQLRRFGLTGYSTVGYGATGYVAPPAAEEPEAAAD